MKDLRKRFEIEIEIHMITCEVITNKIDVIWTPMNYHNSWMLEQDVILGFSHDHK